MLGQARSGIRKGGEVVSRIPDHCFPPFRMFGYFQHIRNANDVGLYIYVGISSLQFSSKYHSDLLEGDYYQEVVSPPADSHLTSGSEQDFQLTSLTIFTS